MSGSDHELMILVWESLPPKTKKVNMFCPFCRVNDIKLLLLLLWGSQKIRLLLFVDLHWSHICENPQYCNCKQFCFAKCEHLIGSLSVHNPITWDSNVYWNIFLVYCIELCTLLLSIISSALKPFFSRYKLKTSQNYLIYLIITLQILLCLSSIQFLQSNIIVKSPTQSHPVPNLLEQCQGKSHMR